MMRPVAVRRSATFAVTPGATSTTSLMTTEDWTRSRSVVAKRASGSDARCSRSGSLPSTRFTVIVSVSLSQLALSTRSQSKSNSTPSSEITSNVVAVATAQRSFFSSAAAKAVIGLRSPGIGGRVCVTQSGTETARRLFISQRYDVYAAFDSGLGPKWPASTGYWHSEENYGTIASICRELAAKNGVVTVPIEGVGEDEPQAKERRHHVWRIDSRRVVRAFSTPRAVPAV